MCGKVAVEPASKKEQDKMTEALIRLAAEDPSFRFSRDDESGQTVIEGMGELHLEVSCVLCWLWLCFAQGLVTCGYV